VTKLSTFASESTFRTGLHRIVVTHLPNVRKSEKLSENGTNRTPFPARSVTPMENRVGRRDTFIVRSRERFATARVEVEEKLNRWIQGSDDDIESVD